MADKVLPLWGSCREATEGAHGRRLVGLSPHPPLRGYFPPEGEDLGIYCVLARAWIAARLASTASGVTVRLWALEWACSWASDWP